MYYSPETIIGSIKSHIQRQKSGYIKLCFEGGSLVTANLYSSPDRDGGRFSSVGREFDIRREVADALRDTFYGTLGIVFSESKITDFYRAQTWKGSGVGLFMRG